MNNIMIDYIDWIIKETNAYYNCLYNNRDKKIILAVLLKQQIENNNKHAKQILSNKDFNNTNLIKISSDLLNIYDN